MKASGDPERFRLEIIKSGVEGFEKMVKTEVEGGRPINRPRSWEADKRQVQKHMKGRNWFRNAGHHVPIFVPHTPGSQLAKLIPAKKEKNNQGRPGNLNWKPNPWCGEKCGQENCFPCRGDRGEIAGGLAAHTR